MRPGTLSGAALVEAGEEVAMGFAVAVEVFVLLELLLEFGFDDVDGGVHVEGAFFDDDGAVRQVERGFAGAVVVVLGLTFFEVDFGVGALPIMG